jgi:RNA polymerase sigma-70 factor (ECF subfamily)
VPDAPSLAEAPPATPSGVEPLPDADSRVSGVRPTSDSLRVETLLKLHYDTIWRFVRRLGVRADRIEDATQEVFIVASSKLDRLELGRELRFLFGVALRVAANHRSAAPVRREIADPDLEQALSDPTPNAEALLDRKRLRVLLDEVLDAMPPASREVFVLHELEGLSAVEIAETLGTALGTVTSRLRRARALFSIASRRIRARYHLEGGMP